ncbi:guanine-1-methyltransferase-domain-containing protein [Aspergillus pseudoustus]|uniref:tRNA (guanine(9)-N1)-methyltransferase n=1 Tax=Aspergillus pseudoustus TaxID=1810923 RepID=A0ABR4IVG6_9EURO
MDEDERPRKIQKLSASDSHDTESLMTGAIGQGNDEKPRETATQNNALATTTENESVDPTAAENGTEGTTLNISKRQLRKQRQREQWEAEREQRKVIRKEKANARKIKKREAWEEAKRQGKDTKEELAKLFPTTSRKGRKPTRVPITLIIDCGFDDLMMEKERVSLAQQLTRSYSENNRSQYNGHLVLSSFNKLLKERFETVLHKTHEHWKGVRFFDEDWLFAANQAADWMQGPEGGDMVGPFENKADAKPEDGEIVYLSSDSSETLTELKPYSTYIIGGLVDKNRHKGICHKRATEMGIKTAKLPIGDYIQMASRSVLATNHVVEIMVRWLQLQDWGEAFMQTIPPRKGGVLRDGGDAQEDTTPQKNDASLDSEKEGVTEPSSIATDAGENDSAGQDNLQDEQ